MSNRRKQLLTTQIWNTIHSFTLNYSPNVPVLKSKEWLEIENYLKNPTMCDIVYEKLILRAQEIAYLPNVIKIMKHGMVMRESPSLKDETLLSIQENCRKWISDIKNHTTSLKKYFLDEKESLIKSIEFVLQLSIHHISRSGAADKITLRIERREAKNNSNSRLFGRMEEEIPFSSGNHASFTPDLRLIPNLVEFRKINPETKNPALQNFFVIQKPQKNSISTHYENSRFLEQIKIVSRSKKSEEEKTLHGNRKKEVPLFQFKYYKEQEPLDLSTDQLELIIKNVIFPQKEEGMFSNRQIATKLLIKIFADMFVTQGSGIAGTAFLSVLFEMIETKIPDTINHALNLLFNMSVHLNLIEDSVNTQQDDQVSIRIQTSSYYNLIEFDTQLFRIFQEILLKLIHNSETDPKIWNSAFHLLCYFVIQNGKLDRSKLWLVDARVIPRMLTHCDRLDNDSYHFLIVMLINILYEDNRNIAIEVLNRICEGEQFLIDHYLRATSVRTLENLFIMIFDVVIQNLQIQTSSSESQEKYFREILKWLFELDAHLHFQKFFCLENFVSGYLFSAFSGISESNPALNPILTKRVLFEFEKLALKYSTLEEEFQVRLENMKQITESNPSDIECLEYLLLKSNDSAEQKNGMFWLFNLIWTREHGKSQLYESTIKHMENLEQNLIKSKESERRLMLIKIYQWTIWAFIHNLKSHSEEEIAGLFPLINQFFGQFITCNETSRPNLLQIFLILLESISCPLNPKESVKPNLSSSFEVGLQEGTSLVYNNSFNSSSINPSFSTPDHFTIIDLFLTGRRGILKPLVHKIDIKLLHYLFKTLPESPFECSSFSSARLALLRLIIEKCSDKNSLESIGGVFFFQGILPSTDPKIAFIAGEWIVEHLEKENPEDYRVLLSKLLQKATSENNESIVSNHYLQIKHILSMKGEQLKTEQNKNENIKGDQTTKEQSNKE